MSLTKNDLENIQEIVRDNVKDTVEFLLEKSEQRTEIKLGKELEKLEDRIVTRINREITDTAQINREMLAKIDNHENRIEKLETKTVSL